MRLPPWWLRAASAPKRVCCCLGAECDAGCCKCELFVVHLHRHLLATGGVVSLRDGQQAPLRLCSSCLPTYTALMCTCNIVAMAHNHARRARAYRRSCSRRPLHVGHHSRRSPAQFSPGAENAPSITGNGFNYIYNARCGCGMPRERLTVTVSPAGGTSVFEGCQPEIAGPWPPDLWARALACLVGALSPPRI